MSVCQSVKSVSSQDVSNVSVNQCDDVQCAVQCQDVPHVRMFLDVKMCPCECEDVQSMQMPSSTSTPLMSSFQIQTRSSLIVNSVYNFKF